MTYLEFNDSVYKGTVVYSANSGAYLIEILGGLIPKSQIQKEGFLSGRRQLFKK